MKIGFLPLYIELYDRVGSATRQMTQPFYDRIADDLSAKGIEVVRNDLKVRMLTLLLLGTRRIHRHLNR